MKFNLRLFLFSRLLLSISSNVAVFASIWWFAKELDSYYFSGGIYLIYRTLEIYLMPFTSAISDSFCRRQLILLGSSLTVILLLVYSLCIIYIGNIPILVSIFGMIILGGMSSISTGLISVYLHDIYGRRIKIPLRLSGIFTAIALILTPLISIAYTITVGSKNAIISALVMSLLATIIQFLISPKKNHIPKKPFFIYKSTLDAINIIRSSLSIDVERNLIIVLLLVNMVMTPFFMVAFPYFSSRGYFTYEQAVAVFDMAFGLGFILSSRYLMKYLASYIDPLKQVTIGMICLSCMLAFSFVFMDEILITLLCIIGGVGLPLVVINISSHRLSHCPQEIKSQVFGTLIFFSLAGNPLSILLTTYILENFSVKYIITYNILLVCFSLIYLIANRKTMMSINSVEPDNIKIYQNAYNKAYQRDI
jgi:MFS family permease